MSGAGDFQLCKIEILKDPFPLNARKQQDMMDSDDVNNLEVLAILSLNLHKEIFYYDIELGFSPS